MRKRIFGKSIVLAGLQESSTSSMLRGLVFKGKTISKVMKKGTGDKRIIYYTDGSKEIIDKDDIKGLARIKGGMEGEQRSQALTPWERQQRMQRGMQVKKSWIERDRKGFVQATKRVDELAKLVEGAPKVKYIKHRGVSVPVIAHYYSTRQPDTKTLVNRVKTDMGRMAAYKLKNKLRTMTPSEAMRELMEEYEGGK